MIYFSLFSLCVVFSQKQPFFNIYFRYYARLVLLEYFISSYLNGHLKNWKVFKLQTKIKLESQIQSEVLETCIKSFLMIEVKLRGLGNFGHLFQ